ncbi:hypothetical protein PR048_014532 [Dryococelus australis]|uniref:Uncharacterized protein n=1 Tax=Dryococelus australis TaxID=614101 RepID=A0ABQ9HEI0_9NEOP|nr:hypothetical protein PR048_014532 [Dryococelus australis]
MARKVTRVKGEIYARKRRQERKLNRNMAKEYTTAEEKSVPARMSKSLKNFRLGCKKLLEISYGDDVEPDVTCGMKQRVLVVTTRLRLAFTRNWCPYLLMWNMFFSTLSCRGQSKISHVSAMFLTAMQNNQHLKTVDHKLMVSGHSHLECDINHARIED